MLADIRGACQSPRRQGAGDLGGREEALARPYLPSNHNVIYRIDGRRWAWNGP